MHTKKLIQVLIAIALAPHYSQYSIGGYLRAIESAQQSLPEPMALTFVPRWHDHPLFRSFIADRIRRAIQQFPVEKRDQVVVLFSAHSLPKRILGDGDPYPAELLDSAAGVATLLDLPTWTFAYQSASPTGEPWLGPDILKALEDLAAQGTLNVVSVPIGFVADHLEVLYDIDIEAQETAQALGMTLVRVAMPNADPAFAALLADVVQQNVPAMV